MMEKVTVCSSEFFIVAGPTFPERFWNSSARKAPPVAPTEDPIP